MTNLIIVVSILLLIQISDFFLLSLLMELDTILTRLVEVGVVGGSGSEWEVYMNDDDSDTNETTTDEESSKDEPENSHVAGLLCNLTFSALEQQGLLIIKVH